MTRGPAELEIDVTLGGVRYRLWRDNQRGPAWWEGPARPDQEGNVEVPVAAIWDRGFFSGMGETLRVGENSTGYAFSVGFDCSAYGFARLAGKRTTVTPASPPVDLPAYGIEDTATAGGDAVYSDFTFTKDTSLGTVSQAVTHGLSVVPKAFIFFTAGGVATGTVANGGRGCKGFSDGTTHRSMAWASDDAAATSNTARRYGPMAIMLIPGTSTTTTVPEATLSAIGATTFSVDWTNNDAVADVIHGVAIGGSEVSASVDEWTLADDANTSVTGVGFQPQVVMHLSAASSAGSTADVSNSFGVMDESGNQWTNRIFDDDAAATTSCGSQLYSTKCILAGTAATSTTGAVMTSMDADGFTCYGTAGTGAFKVASLSLRGIQVKVGNTTKKTSTGNQAAESIGFTSTAFMVASHGATTVGGAGDAIYSFGAVSGSAVEAMNWLSEHNAADSDVYAVDDIALAMEIVTNAGSEANLATSGTADMQTAGWLAWAATDANAYLMGYIALAALSPNADATKYIKVLNGQRDTTMSVSSTPAITVQKQKDFGGGARAGRPTKGGTTESLWRIPLGASVDATTLTTIASGSSADTYTAMSGIKSLAFSTTIDGVQSVINRAHSGNKVDVSTDNCATFGADFAVGTTGETITSMIDSGTELFVFTNSNAYKVRGGIAQKVTRFPVNDKNDNFGAGSMVPAGSDAFLYNHRGIHLYDGTRVDEIGPDSNPINRAIPGVSYEPFRVEITEIAYGSDNWLWAAARVTETVTTKTYIMAGYRSPGSTQVIWHTYDRFDGWARLIPIDGGLDSNRRLWFAYSGGTYGFYQLGFNGEPDSGRNSVGHGAASTTYTLYLSETDFGLPQTTKEFRGLEVNLYGLDSTMPVTLSRQIDGGSFSNLPGGTITSNGVSTRFPGSTTSGVRWRFAAAMTTGADFLTASDPQLLSVVARAVARPSFARKVTVLIDTSETYSDGSEHLLSAAEQRSNLRALQNSTPTTCVDPDGTTRTIVFHDVSDQRLVDDKGVARWVMALEGYAFNTTTTST